MAIQRFVRKWSLWLICALLFVVLTVSLVSCRGKPIRETSIIEDVSEIEDVYELHAYTIRCQLYEQLSHVSHNGLDRCGCRYI